MQTVQPYILVSLGIWLFYNMLYGFRKVINVPKTLANWNKRERVAERKKINAYKVYSAT